MKTKKRMICLMLALIICFAAVGSTYALGDDLNTTAPQTRGAIGLSYGLSSLGNGRYRPWATVETATVESLYVSFTLYRIVNGTRQYVTSASASGSGVEKTASKTVTLSSGTYLIVAYGSGNTTSGSGSRYYSI
jgi:hypothetical protein